MDLGEGGPRIGQAIVPVYFRDVVTREQKCSQRGIDVVSECRLFMSLLLGNVEIVTFISVLHQQENFSMGQQFLFTYLMYSLVFRKPLNYAYMYLSL